MYTVNGEDDRGGIGGGRLAHGSPVPSTVNVNHVGAAQFNPGIGDGNYKNPGAGYCGTHVCARGGGPIILPTRFGEGNGSGSGSGSGSTGTGGFTSGTGGGSGTTASGNSTTPASSAVSDQIKAGLIVAAILFAAKVFLKG